MSQTSIPPVGEEEGKKEKVERMFDSIAPRYDLLNRVLSLGIDQSWRRKMVATLARRCPSPKRILDVATGTADVAIELRRLGPEAVVGVDISEEMLAIGREKVRDVGAGGVITLATGDAQQLSFQDDHFDAVTVAFGVRNFEQLGEGLREMARVLRPGGAVVILEFSSPQRAPMKQLYAFYSRHILPRVGRVVSGDKGAYTYLPESAAAFPFGERMARIIEEAGFEEVEVRPLTFGIVTIYSAVVR
ncbi:MAG: bifunctional demethylmenaquinone methyltransferase/2-methoxy-6-polyprenyl-1,4-benzoquinol methylase UbiE [Rhodothermales bacterium]|nr:bifunctional demethylmenaquinone methyltransferase/2-methoxy-6-polyprenyl-1,4-benzoquinol methylase UbiE [Rhodothermales bacterium]